MWSLRELLKKRIEGEVIISPTNEAYEKLWEENGKKEIDKIVQGYAESFKEASNRYVLC